MIVSILKQHVVLNELYETHRVARTENYACKQKFVQAD